LQAAALRDVVTALARRAPYARVVIYPVPVQGAEAAERIAAMLARANERADAQVLLLVRGGGSIEDLWAFNEEVLARAIVASRLPVVVGVGHESDVTIADFVADLRAATPTAAAELAAPAASALLAQVAERFGRAGRALGARLQAAGQRLDYALRALQGPQGPLRGLAGRLEHLELRRRRALAVHLARANQAIGAADRLRRRAGPDIAGRSGRIERLVGSAAAAVRRELALDAAQLDAARRALAALDPRAVLQRGYALARGPDGHVVMDAERLAVGARLHLQFARGAAVAEVVVPDAAPASAGAAIGHTR